MSQALASLSRNLVPLLICTFIAACNGSYTAFESDQDFDVDLKTVDIEQDNAELITLGALQSAFFGHYQSAINEFLDASDLPIDAVPTNNTNEYERICNDGGSVLYKYTRDSGEEHKTGDTISVKYNQCMESGNLYTGSIDGRYTKIKGLNNRFVELDTNQCLARVQDEYDFNNRNVDIVQYDAQNDQYILNGTNILIPGSVYSNVDFSNIYLPGDELRFENVGGLLRVDLLNTAFVNNGEDDTDDLEKIITVAFSFLIEDDEKVVFILGPREPNSEMLTSIDGDQLYVVEGVEYYKQACQSYERTLSVSLNNLSTSKDNFLETVLNGSITLVEAQETPGRLNQSIVDSDFTTTVIQRNSIQQFSMKDYTVEKALNLATNSYAYEFEGLVSNDDMFGGTIELTTLGKLFGSFDSDYPFSGGFELKGQDLERVNLVPDNLKVSLQVDYNGDSTGNSFGDIDVVINTTWADLFERNFKE